MQGQPYNDCNTTGLENMAQLIVSVSGVRGIVGDGLTPEIAARFAAAFGADLGGGQVLLSRDSRPHGVDMRAGAIRGLAAAGCVAIDAGILPTPTAGLAVKALGLAGGLQITASHNPAPWNGLKMFGPDGAVLPAAEGEKVRARFEATAAATQTSAATLPPQRDPLALHTERVLAAVDAAKIRAGSFAVLLDANGGAGGPLGRKLLEALGVTVTPIACETDGVFRHEPEPTPTHLPTIAAEARQRKMPAFCLDPDADRLALIDETGACLSEELTLALAVQFRLGQQVGPVVVNMSTSRAIEDICKAHGAPFFRTAVGEANVVAGMREHDALVGGEGNGGVIDPRIGWVRDPFIGMAMILDAMAVSGRTLAQLAADLPRYVIVKDKLTLPPERLPAVLADLERQWPEAAVDRRDGLRLDWPDRWLHVRGSNTEPIVRIIAEAPSEAGAMALIDQAKGRTN